MNTHVWAAARRNEKRATERIVSVLRPHLVKLTGHYARRTGQPAEDLLQEAWLGVLDALPSLDLTCGSPEQYLAQRARWRILDAIRRSHLRRTLPLDEAWADTLPDLQLADQGELLAVREFVQGLKATPRAILCCLLSGSTWREAGEQVGCTSANVAYHVRQIQTQFLAWREAAPEQTGPVKR